MEFKLAAKAAAAWPAPARRGEKGGSRVGFGFGSAAMARTKALRGASNSATPVAREGRVDKSEIVALDSIRQTLIRLEDSVIFGLLERAQYCYNVDTYASNSFLMEGFEGSLVEYMVRETEKLHVQVGRYNSPDEHPFFPDDLPEPLLLPMQYPKALSKRIHYGKFVAEARFQQSPEAYRAAIEAQDLVQLMELLTYETVERAVEHRVEAKAKIFGQEVKIGAPPAGKINPSLVAGLYRRIMR